MGITEKELQALGVNTVKCPLISWTLRSDAKFHPVFRANACSKAFWVKDQPFADCLVCRIASTAIDPIQS